ncbi:MAG TPA: hypothetical protein VHW04_18300 [Solirubrobacteraceae bacterium]|jgi:hypothetical protein|nr:hypothetical protein [Solirubrobacteraceae bacterium]
MKTVLVVANETIGGQPLIEAVQKRAREQDDVRFVLCVPQTQPRAGYVVYDDTVFDAAQIRVDLAVGFVRSEGMEAVGEVGDPDPYAATMDAVREYEPDEIIISTLPESRSGWLRRDLVERIRQASGLPVEHVIADLDSDGMAVHITLVVANRTGSGDELLEALKAKAAKEPDKRERLFLVVVPQEGGDGSATRRARTRLALILRRLRDAGLTASGMTGDPDPYTAIMNALQAFRVDDIVISTFAETKSGWLRADLIERVRNATGKDVEHVVQTDSMRATA